MGRLDGHFGHHGLPRTRLGENDQILLGRPRGGLRRVAEEVYL